MMIKVVLYILLLKKHIRNSKMLAAEAATALADGTLVMTMMPAPVFEVDDISSFKESITPSLVFATVGRGGKWREP